MKVALLNPPWKRPGHYGVRAGSRWPHFMENGNRYMPFPFYLGYAAALLEPEGFEVAIFDGCATKENDDSYLHNVTSFAPDFIVQENATASIETDLQWAKSIKEKTSAFLLMTGHHVNQMSDGLEKHAFLDALAGGEWEYTVLEAAQRIRDKKNLQGLQGLIHRHGPGGSIVHEPRRPNIEPLDQLPFPHRSTLDMSLYYDNPGDLPSPSLQLHGSRGCPYTCNFCVWPQVVYKDHRYRVFSAKYMADEIEQMFRHDPFPYKSYYFDDDTWNIGNRRLSDFADEIISRGLEQIPWGAMCRADTLKKSVLEKLRKAGLHAVKYGVESGNQKIVDDCGKRLNLQVLRDTVAFTHDLGIKTHLTFSFGLIGETRKTMQETLDLALELNPHTVQFSISTPFPGTEFYEYARERNLLMTTDFSAYDGLSQCVVRADRVSAQELEDFLRHAYETWRKHEARRKGFLRRVLKNPVASLKLAMANPKQAKQYLAGFITRS